MSAIILENLESDCHDTMKSHCVRRARAMELTRFGLDAAERLSVIVRNRFTYPSVNGIYSPADAQRSKRREQEWWKPSQANLRRQQHNLRGRGFEDREWPRAFGKNTISSLLHDGLDGNETSGHGEAADVWNRCDRKELSPPP